MAITKNNCEFQATTITIPSTIATCSFNGYGIVPSLNNSFSENLSSLSSIVITYNTNYGIFGLKFNYNNSTSSNFCVNRTFMNVGVRSDF